VAAIFDTNAFMLVNDDSIWERLGICLPATRMNHSCLPNSFHYWNEKLGQHVVHVIKDVSAGEELTIAYVQPVQARTARRGQLRAKYGFDCGCAACDLSTVFGRESEQRREISVVMRDVLDTPTKERESSLFKFTVLSGIC